MACVAAAPASCRAAVVQRRYVAVRCSAVAPPQQQPPALARRAALAGALGAAVSFATSRAARAAAQLPTETDDASSAYIQGLKAKSEALREQRKKERLEAYTLKNFGDYFDFVEGSQRGELSENDKAIRAWLEKRDAALKK